MPVAIVTLCATISACGGGGDAGPPPVPAAHDDFVTVDEDSTTTVNIVANDVGMNASSATITTGPANGTASLVAGTLTYTPFAEFSGGDSVTYNVLASASGTPHTAVVHVTVIAVNDAPVAADDLATIGAGGSTVIDVLANDSDADDSIDDLTIELLPGAGNGPVALLADRTVSYQPPPGFSGCDEVPYRLRDPGGATSNSSRLRVTVFAPNTITATPIPVPASGYAPVSASLLRSPPVDLLIPPGTVSFVLSLVGPAVTGPNTLSVLDVANPAGVLLNPDHAIFCDLGLCTVQVPRRPDIPAAAGTWHVHLAAETSDIATLDPGDWTLTLVTRDGSPGACVAPAVITANAFATGAVASDTILAILDRLVVLAADNGVDLRVNPLIRITDPQFAEVSSNFDDPTTAALVRQGSPNEANVFFIETFSDAGGAGTLGIAGGIPGSLGVVTEYNGVLVNATATGVNGNAFHQRTTAEIAFHEMGHLLGLFHTSESSGDVHDVLDDTPNCTPANDTNHDGDVNSDECSDGLNPMFWENDLTRQKTALSDDQRTVIERSPITRVEVP